MKEWISIQTRHLKKTLRKTVALKDVTLNFEAENMHGLIGPDGAGKTTLLRILIGLLKPTEGEVLFQRGNTVLKFSQIKENITYMPQQPSLYPDLSVEEHLLFFKKLYQIDDQTYQQRKEELLEITNLKPFLNRRAQALSGGMYKKLGLICALLRTPEVIILDEPTNGVDPISRREFWELLYQLLEQKILIIVATAYMDEAERCTRVHLLESGRVMASGEPHALLEQASVKSFDALFLKQKVDNKDGNNPDE